MFVLYGVEYIGYRYKVKLFRPTSLDRINEKSVRKVVEIA